MAKDKFQQMRQKRGDGAISSFQDLATTVAAIEKQAGQTVQSTPSVSPATDVVQADNAAKNSKAKVKPASIPPVEVQRFMRLPNPQIPVSEYNMVSAYCNSFPNMTRQDFVELAIIEKLHSDGQMPDDEFNIRHNEICNRPTRGQRKGMRNK